MIPALIPDRGSRSALYQDELATGIAAQGTFHPLAACLGIRRTRRTCRETWKLPDDNGIVIVNLHIRWRRRAVVERRIVVVFPNPPGNQELQ
jgi:hypothetical protein